MIAKISESINKKKPITTGIQVIALINSLEVVQDSASAGLDKVIAIAGPYANPIKIKLIPIKNILIIIVHKCLNLISTFIPPQ